MKPLRILLVDDHEVVRLGLATLLEDIPGVLLAGEAGSGSEALQACERLQPDVVILDIRMPGGCGIDVLNTIEKDGCTPIIIMLTNYPYPQYRKKCFDAGADFFFDKSSEFEKVIDVLQCVPAGKDGVSLAPAE